MYLQTGQEPSVCERTMKVGSSSLFASRACLDESMSVTELSTYDARVVASFVGAVATRIVLYSSAIGKTSGAVITGFAPSCCGCRSAPSEYRIKSATSSNCSKKGSVNVTNRTLVLLPQHCFSRCDESGDALSPRSLRFNLF